MKAWEATVEVLLETQNPSIMYGDEWLCHQVAERLKWQHEGPKTSRRLLSTLSKTPGCLIKGYCKMPSDCCAKGQSVLHFELPDELLEQSSMDIRQYL
jgi:hypothetical protein